MRLDQENHYPDDAQQARVSDLDLILASPYRPAACEVPQSEVGHTSEPDHIAKTSSKENACITRGVHTRPVSFSALRPFLKLLADRLINVRLSASVLVRR